MFDDRETVSPATPARPEERATPVVLSGGTVCVGVTGEGRVVSYVRSSPVALHDQSIANGTATAMVQKCFFICTTGVDGYPPKAGG
jgi:hypothetical protein